jgi:hypothetical protein
MKRAIWIKRLGLGAVVLGSVACGPSLGPDGGSDAGARPATDGGADGGDGSQGADPLIGTWRAVLPDPTGSDVASNSGEVTFGADGSATMVSELRTRADAAQYAGCVFTYRSSGCTWSTASTASGPTLTVSHPTEQTETIADCVDPSINRPATAPSDDPWQPIENAPYTLTGDTLVVTVMVNGLGWMLTFRRE